MASVLGGNVRGVYVASFVELVVACACVAGLGAGSAAAQSPRHLLEHYAAQALGADPTFTEFSSERGRAFYFAPRVIVGLGEASCASCHLDDPTQPIRAHRAKVLCRACHVINDTEHPDPEHAKKRHLQPFSPAANPERFRDLARTDRYFDVNCRMLLQRDCTAREKGDLITWLLGLR